MQQPYDIFVDYFLGFAEHKQLNSICLWAILPKRF